MSVLMCPVCSEALNMQGQTWRCSNSHSYDVAKQGYVNLHVVQHKHSKQPGDTPASVAARQQFLDAGFYQNLQQAVLDQLQQLQPQNLLDIGCGEGYYTAAMQSQVAQHCIGLDIAKNAVQRAAKRNKDVIWVVATGATLPVLSQSIDVCTSLFSPIPTAEIMRVLRANGYLIIVTPATDHLLSLRQALFDQVQAHMPEKFLQALQPYFDVQHAQIIQQDFELEAAQLAQLIAMTPYAYKAKPEKIQVVLSKSSLVLQAQFQMYVLQRKAIQ